MYHSYGTLDILDKEIANMGNEQKRHCRIGKVSPKPVQRVPDSLDLLKLMSRSLPIPAHEFQRRYLGYLVS